MTHMTVAQILIDRSDMEVDEFLRKYPEYPFDSFETMAWLTKVAREETRALGVAENDLASMSFAPRVGGRSQGAAEQRLATFDQPFVTAVNEMHARDRVAEAMAKRAGYVFGDLRDALTFGVRTDNTKHFWRELAEVALSAAAKVQP